MHQALALEIAALTVVQPRRDEVSFELVQGRVADGRENLLEREAGGNGFADLVEGHRLAQAQVLRRETLLLEPALNDANDLFDLEGLEDVVVRAPLHRVDGGLDRAEPRHDHGERIGGRGPDRVEQLDPAHARHLEVADDEVVVRVVELGEGGRAVLGGPHDVTLHPEEIGQDVPDELLVVDNEDARSLVVGGVRHGAERERSSVEGPGKTPARGSQPPGKKAEAPRNATTLPDPARSRGG